MSLRDHREVILALLTIALDKCLTEAEERKPLFFSAQLEVTCDKGVKVASRPVYDMDADPLHLRARVIGVSDEEVNG